MEKLEATFVIKFLEYSNWPDKKNKERISVTFLGGSKVFDEFERFSKMRKIAGVDIETKIINSISEVKDCHLVFVSKDKKGELKNLLESIKGTSTIIVSDSPGLCQKGAFINFVMLDGRLKYEISQKRFADEGVKISREIVSMGIAVN